MSNDNVGRLLGVMVFLPVIWAFAFGAGYAFCRMVKDAK